MKGHLCNDCEALLKREGNSRFECPDCGSVYEYSTKPSKAPSEKFNTANGKTVEVTKYSDGSISISIDGNIEWVGDIQTLRALAHGVSQGIRLND
jgi:predicted RNA-binding Zn-ribbon protein involved in translation (DUF1610 family)